MTGPVMIALPELRARLRARGERMTRPRRIVLAVLADQVGHLSAEQIVTAVAERDPAIHRATVYRTLETLADIGLVQHVHLGHGPTLYHLTPAGGDHVHLQCVSCGAVSDAPVDVLAVTAERLHRTLGFQLDLGHVALSGTCTDCSTAEIDVHQS